LQITILISPLLSSSSFLSPLSSDELNCLPNWSGLAWVLLDSLCSGHQCSFGLLYANHMRILEQWVHPLWYNFYM
jgi:hypothetical protein